MRLGLDLGTTRTTAAHVDRGNYPVVSFLDGDGDAFDYVPTVVAFDGETMNFGFDAIEAHRTRNHPILRSFKRELATPDVTAGTTVRIGPHEVLLLDVMSGFLSYVRELLHRSSSVSTPLAASPLEQIAIAVPAHAHGSQRFFTLEAFRRAGFDVASVLNEPSAAGFEYTHRQGGTLNSRRTRVLVYDLGGGTFDSSLVRVDGTAHEILGTFGVNRLGGDDFDVVLADRALRQAGLTIDRIGVDEYATLLDAARVAKESLSPQSRRIVVTLRDEDVVVPVDDFYAAVTPLVEKTVEAMAPLVGGLDDAALASSDVAGIYLVGGASELPIVARLLRERFGRRVHRSPLPAGSTAIGLAISLDPDAGYSLSDQLSRGVGVFREGDSGTAVTFDPIISPGERVPSEGVVRATRRYRPVHNVVWLRFVEYSHLDDDGQPRGDLAPIGQILFPVDSSLRDGRDLTVEDVLRTGEGHEIEESYEVDPSGMVRVAVRELETGYELETGFGG